MQAVLRSMEEAEEEVSNCRAGSALVICAYVNQILTYSAEMPKNFSKNGVK